MAKKVTTLFYLKHRQQTLRKSVKVPTGFITEVIIAKFCTEDLHPQKCKNAHEQKEKDEQGSN